MNEFRFFSRSSFRFNLGSSLATLAVGTSFESFRDRQFNDLLRRSGSLTSRAELRPVPMDGISLRHSGSGRFNVVPGTVVVGWWWWWSKEVNGASERKGGKAVVVVTCIDAMSRPWIRRGGGNVRLVWIAQRKILRWKAKQERAASKK